MICPNKDLQKTRVARLVCPGCGIKMSKSSPVAGMRIACPACGRAFALRPPSQSATPIAPPRVTTSSPPTVPRIHSQPAQKSFRRKCLEMGLLAVVVMLFGAIVTSLTPPPGAALTQTAEGDGLSPNATTSEPTQPAETDAPKAGLFEKMVDIGTGRSNQDKILGKWYEVGGSEELEFFAEGTINVTNVVQDQSVAIIGDYRFLGEDDNRLRIDLRGVLGNMAGPQIWTVAVTNSELKVSSNNSQAPGGRYRRSPDKRTREEAQQLALDLNDIQRTNDYVTQVCKSANVGNDLILKEEMSKLDRQVKSLVGKKASWQFQVISVLSEYVLIASNDCSIPSNKVSVNFLVSDNSARNGVSYAWRKFQRDDPSPESQISKLCRYNKDGFSFMSPLRIGDQISLNHARSLRGTNKMVERNDCITFKDNLQLHKPHPGSSVLTVCGVVESASVYEAYGGGIGGIHVSLRDVRAVDESDTTLAFNN